MAGIYLEGHVDGSSGTRLFKFLIVDNAWRLGLPRADIESLRLQKSVFTREGSGDYQVFQAGVHFGQSYVELDVVPSLEPTVGLEVVSKLGYQVDLKNSRIVSAEKPIKIYRGLMPGMLDVDELQSDKP